MKIIEKILEKQNDLKNAPGITIACLGDSVTQGCFDLYLKDNGVVETVFDQNGAYHSKLAQILSILYPAVPFSVINAGISGDTARDGKKRLERDVLNHNPDLVIVCFGLNDVCNGMEGLSAYQKSLVEIFNTLKNHAMETIFLTPNTMCTKVSCHLHNPEEREIAQSISQLQNSGILDQYVQTAREVCKQKEIPVCDCYAKWECLRNKGVDINNLLANHINHPTRELHWLFAAQLLETMLQD